MGVIEKQRDLRCGRRLRGLIHFGPPEQDGRVRFAGECPGDQIMASVGSRGRGGVRLDTIAVREVAPGLIIGGPG